MPRVVMLAVLLAALQAPPVFAQSEPVGLAWQLTYSFNMDNALSPDGGAWCSSGSSRAANSCS